MLNRSGAGLLEEEFKKDGIKIQWTFLRGAGPAVNELFANGLLDSSHLGDLPSVVGRASTARAPGLPTCSLLAEAFVSGLRWIRGPGVHEISDANGREGPPSSPSSTPLSGDIT